jgi:hypothetical protein
VTGRPLDLEDNPGVRQYPTTLPANLKQLRLVYGALLSTNVLYLWIVNLMPPAISFRFGFFVTLALAAWAILSLSRAQKIRSSRLLPALEVLRIKIDDRDALARVRTGSVISASLAEAVAVSGFVLHILGRNLEEVLPFFLVSSAALIIWWPKRP